MIEPERKYSKETEDKKNIKWIIINDIVHGIIKLPAYIQDIIDTVQFQRLRCIAQLGFASFVYPSASYSRFEHSIGTFHLASELMKQIKIQLEQDYKNKEILSDDDIKCVEIAALCHDLGHGPYSHFWEHAFDDSLNVKNRKHEDLSVEIFIDLVNSIKTNHDWPIKDEIGLDEKMIDLIGRIISGRYDIEKDGNKKFLFEIVANKISGVDVDKFDYLCRDSIYFGWSNKNKIHDIKRVMHFFRVNQDKTTKNWHLAMRDREMFHIHDLFYFRHLLHRYGYQHKTVKAIECMFRKALKRIVENENHLNELIENVFGKKVEYKCDTLFSKEFISRVCDYHIWNIMNKHTNDIVKDIQERNLCKLYIRLQIEIKNNENANIHRDISKLQSFLNKNLSNCSVNIVLSIFALQSENKGNPLLSVKFYKKDNPKKCFYFDENSLPDLVKLKSDESIIMIFIDKMANDESKNYLNNFKIKLCGDGNELSDKEIIELREKYNFKEIQY